MRMHKYRIILERFLLLNIAGALIIFYFFVDIGHSSFDKEVLQDDFQSRVDNNEAGNSDVVTLFVAVVSTPQNIERRNALRTSWLKQCQQNAMPCFFFTCGKDTYGKLLPTKILVPLLQEQKLHGDLILAQSPGGINFALRYLWMLNWANSRYTFQYFLRVDDDYFVCMDRLVRELPQRPRKKLYWGHVNCNPPGGIRVDEGFVIVSNDLAQYFLREQNKTLMCHPYGDQALAMWINNIPEVTYFGDSRIHNDVISTRHFLKFNDICAKYIALRGALPTKMKLFWEHYRNAAKNKLYMTPPITFPCSDKDDRALNYGSFSGKYRAIPRPCRKNPIWVIGGLDRATVVGSNSRKRILYKIGNQNNNSPGSFNDVKSREILTLFVAIMSAPQRFERRNAVRTTWLKQCRLNGIPCLFFTDAQDMYGKLLPAKIRVKLEQENELHGDLILAQSPGGINFARRYLWMLNWASTRYRFDYFLRVDDDYFICMDRLLRELPYRQKRKLYWGYMHCNSPPGAVRIDEGFVIVSNDLAQQFLREQYTTLMCHPFGTQAIVMWINSITGVTYFGDSRVHHAVVSVNHILQNENICENFLALHGAYPLGMGQIWKHYQNSKKTTSYLIPPVTYPCGNMSRTSYDYRKFNGIYRAKPKPCREKPVWTIADFYPGRSGKNRLVATNKDV